MQQSQATLDLCFIKTLFKANYCFVLYLKINYNKQPPFGVKNNMLGYLSADIFI